MSRSRAFCFTRNNYADEHATMIKALNSNYVVVGAETGESGTPHLQGFVYMRTQTTVSALAKKLVGFHIEIKSDYSTFKQASDYCKKQGDFWEDGVQPKDPVDRGADEKTRWDDMYAAAQDGRFADIPTRDRVQYDLTWHRIRMRHQQAQPPATLSTLEHEWHWGAPGTGKSRGVRAAHPDAYIKNANKWWDGYSDQEVVILDDLDTKHECLAYHLKIWADHYAFTAEIKGGSMFIRPRKLIITSNYAPEDIFTDSTACSAIRRRFNVHHYAHPYQ